jgi:hypothetical protein
MEPSAFYALASENEPDEVMIEAARRAAPMNLDTSYRDVCGDCQHREEREP